MKKIVKNESGYFIKMNRDSVYFQRVAPDTTAGDPLNIPELVITNLCESMLNIKNTERRRLRELVQTVWMYGNEHKGVPFTVTIDELIDKVFKSDE